MEIISAPADIELQSIALIISPSSKPTAPPTLALINITPGATPLYSPDDPPPLPPIIPAT